jgi:hypothetical protein
MFYLKANRETENGTDFFTVASAASIAELQAFVKAMELAEYGTSLVWLEGWDLEIADATGRAVLAYLGDADDWETL